MGGLTLADLQCELEQRFDAAQALLESPAPEQLPTLGLTTWRPQGGEDHLIDPAVIYTLQRACREGNFELFRTYSDLVHRPGRAVRLRDLIDFDASGRTPVPLEEVESARSIVRRFKHGRHVVWLDQPRGP